jgi:hypothetical protein
MGRIFFNNKSGQHFEELIFPLGDRGKKTPDEMEARAGAILNFLQLKTKAKL